MMGENNTSKNKSFIIFLVIVAVVVVGVLIATFNNQSSNEDSSIIKNKTISAKEDNESVVNNSGTVVLENDVIEKTGDTDDVTESDKKGKNAAILANSKTDLEVTDCTIKADGLGATGIAVTDVQAEANVTGTTIETSGDRSKGLLASDAARINASNVTIKTTGYKSSAVATDFRGGTITVKDSTLETNNVDSVGVYATGRIEVENTKITTNGAEGAVIDGSGTITLNNVDITASKKRGAMIYYTGPQINENITGRFSMTNGSLTVKEGPAFYVMNTAGEITLENVKISTSSNVLLKASVDEFGELGQENAVTESKGGDCTLIARNQVLEGDIIVDNQSTLDLQLTEGSSYKGQINGAKTAKNIKLQVESGCTIELTGDSYITDLEVNGTVNIITNGYKLYYKNGTNVENIKAEGNGAVVKY